tara:strand:+ start:34 stop:306 length:273 start_codon:yes stop_codon:yes gene_type:complete
MEVILIILLSLAVFGCTYIIWNLNNKVVNYENRIEEYENWISDFSDTVKDVDIKLKDIDSKGTFESDDEVGIFFVTLKTLMNQITDYWEK